MTTTDKGTLLIVDDEVTICTLLEHSLSNHGFHVFRACSGEQGLEIATKEGVDTALVDIGLPGMSGLELTRKLVKTTGTTVLLMTGDDTNYSDRTAVREGAMDFILKPIRLSELPLRIERARELKESVAAKNRTISGLERLATVDELTQLQNARQFYSQLEAEVDRAHRYGRPLSMVLLDIDNFKRVNDTFGHPTGNAALRAVAETIATTSRLSDNVFRYGGEEFACILPETATAQAERMTARVRQAVEALGEVDGHALHLTISAGVGTLGNAEQADAFMRRVDTALYGAKHEGRNRVVCASEAPAGPDEVQHHRAARSSEDAG